MKLSDRRSLRKISVPTRFCETCFSAIARGTRINTTRYAPKRYRTMRFCSLECKNAWMKESFRGTKNPNYKHGLSGERERLRGSSEYRRWRKGVFERDNFICVFCAKKGGDLNADHIKPLSVYPELALNLDNGRTLCVPCHKMTYSYGNTKMKES